MEFLADVDDELDYNEDDLPSLSDTADSGDRGHGHVVAPLGSYHRSNSINQHGRPRENSSTSSCISSSPREEGEAYSDEDEQPQVPITTTDHPPRDATAGRLASGRHQDERVHDSRSSRKQYLQAKGEREEGEASSDDESNQQQQQSAKGFRKRDSSSLVPPLLSGEEAEAQYKHRLQERYTQRFRGEEVSKKGDLSEKRRCRDAVEPVHGEREKESRRSVKHNRPIEGKFIEPRSTFTIEPVEDRPLSKSGGRGRVEEQFDNQEQQSSRRQHSRSSRTKQEHAANESLDAYESSGRDPRHYDASPPFKSLPATGNDAISRSYSASYLPAQRNESDSQRNDYLDEAYCKSRDKRVEQMKATSSDMQLDQQPDKDCQHRAKKSKRDRGNKDKDEKMERTTERNLRRILLAQQQQQQLKHNPSSTSQLDHYASLDSAQGYKKYRASSNPSKRRSPSPGSPRPSPSRSVATLSTSSSASSSPSRRPHRNHQTLAERRPKEAYLGEDTDRYYHQQQPKQSRGGRGHGRDDELSAMDDGDAGDYSHKRGRKHATDSYKHKLAEPTDDRSVAEKRGKTYDEVEVRQKRRKASLSSPTDPVLELQDSQALGRSRRTHRSRHLKRSPFPADNRSSSSGSSNVSANSEHARGKRSDQSDAYYHQTLKMEDVEGRIGGVAADSSVKSLSGSGEYATQEAVGNVETDAERLKAEASVEETQRLRRPLSYTGPPAHLFSESESDEPSDPEMLNHGTVEDILLQRQHGTPPESMTETDDRANPTASPPLPPQLAGARLYSSKPFYYPSIQGCRSVEEFECLNRIEEGTYGVVYRARDKKINEIVALKRLKMEKERDGFPITSLREINTLMKAQHENIVTVREIVVGSNMDKIYLVMDYVEHDLKSLMEIMNGPFSVGEVKCLLVQLLRAVRHLHDNWILHRDLKTSNLLLSHQGILKVGDFGLAREYGSPLKHYTEVVVTLWYRAPELLLGVKQYTCPIDLWSVGCIFAEFLLQRPLFPGKGEVDELNIVFRDLGTPTEKIWPGVGQLPGMKKCAFTEYPYNQLRRRFTEKQISDQGFDLLNSFLTYCPERRVTAEKALGHAYFTERPRAIHPSMFPSWPAKSEGGVAVRKASPRPQAGGGALAAAAAAASASVGGGGGTTMEDGRVRYQPPAPPMGGQRFYSSMGDSLPGTAVASSGGAGEPNASGGVDRGFFLRF